MKQLVNTELLTMASTNPTQINTLRTYKLKLHDRSINILIKYFWITVHRNGKGTRQYLLIFMYNIVCYADLYINSTIIQINKPKQCQFQRSKLTNVK